MRHGRRYLWTNFTGFSCLTPVPISWPPGKGLISHTLSGFRYRLQKPVAYKSKSRVDPPRLGLSRAGLNHIRHTLRR